MESHDYKKFSKEYSGLCIKDTFYLGYRDIPKFIKKYVKGKNALDFGCGTGRSTRFLKKLGFEAVGVDISQDMINKAKEFDLQGEYYLIKNNTIPFKDSSFDMVLIFAVLMEITSKEKMKEIFFEINRVLNKDGIIIIVTDAEEMYKHDCASFIYSFPENKDIKSGMQVKLRFRGKSIIFYDYYWIEKDYKERILRYRFSFTKTAQAIGKGKRAL